MDTHIISAEIALCCCLLVSNIEFILSLFEYNNLNKSIRLIFDSNQKVY